MVLYFMKHFSHEAKSATCKGEEFGETKEFISFLFCQKTKYSIQMM